MITNGQIRISKSEVLNKFKIRITKCSISAVLIDNYYLSVYNYTYV